MKKVAILAAPGFEEIELMAPLDILRRLNMDVVLACAPEPRTRVHHRRFPLRTAEKPRTPG